MAQLIPEVFGLSLPKGTSVPLPIKESIWVVTNAKGRSTDERDVSGTWYRVTVVYFLVGSSHDSRESLSLFLYTTERDMLPVEDRVRQHVGGWQER